MKSMKLSLLACTTVALLTATAAHAQFHLPGVLSSSPAAGSSDPIAAQDALVKSFVGSQTEVLAAQILLSKAYDLKDQAALLQSQQTALRSGAVDTDTLEKTVDISSKANDEITTQQNKQTTLTAQEKDYYAQSLPHFAKGVVGTHDMVVQAQKFTTTAKGSMTGLSGLTTGMTKLKSGVFVARSTPSYSKNLFDVFRKTMAISQSNGVKAPSDATKALGSL
jgi:hypothetical protein